MEPVGVKEYSAKKPYILLPSSSASSQFKQISYQAVQRVVGKVVAGTVLVVKGFEAAGAVVFVAEGAAFGVDAGDGQAVGGQLVAGVRADRLL